jgi:hypothetical protein
MVLEADDEVIGIAHNDHVASGHLPSPARGPEVEGIVQVELARRVISLRCGIRLRPLQSGKGERHEASIQTS